jgi:hypothetical protein
MTKPDEKAPEEGHELADLFMSMVELNQVFQKLNEFLITIGKCERCKKNYSAMVAYTLGKFDKEPQNTEKLKNALCKKHRKMFEELEELMKKMEED